MLSTKLMLAMVSLVIGTALAVGILTYRTLAAAVIPSERQRLESHARQLGFELDSSVSNAKANILSIRHFPPLDAIARARDAGGIDPKEGSTEAVWLDRLATIFRAELVANHSLANLRVIEISGREILNVDRRGPNGTIRRVPQAELLNRKDRDYFRETIGLAEDLVHISPISLARPAGAVLVPHMPVMRVATPVRFTDGRPLGLLICNIDMRPVLANLRTEAVEGGKLFVVDGRGSYLLHPDPKQEFALDLEGTHRWQDDLPQFDNVFRIGKAIHGEASDAEGKFFGVAAPSRPGGGAQLAVIETIPESTLLAALAPIERASLTGGVAAAIVALLCAVIIANSLTKPLRSLTAEVDRFTGDKPIKSPAGATGEVGSLARAFVDMGEDIRERTTRLRNLYEQERRLSAVVEWSADAVISFDFDGTVLAWNPAAEQLYGIEAEDAIGRNVEQIVPSEWRPQMQELILRVEGGEAIKNAETVRVGQEGKLIDVALTLSRIEGEGDHTGFVSEIARDMTEHRRLNQRLRQGQKMEALGTLAGGIAHDFNNILSAISGNVAMAKEEPGLTESARESHREIEKAVTRATYIVRQILTFSSNRESEPTVIEVGPVLEEAVKLLRATIPAGITVSLSVEEHVPRILASVTDIHQILLNLGINASHAMGAGIGQFEIHANSVNLDETTAKSLLGIVPGKYVRLSFGDTGCGMDAQTLQRVFEPFFTTKAPGEGTGLGLAVVYGIVERHGGAITVYSEPHKGTVFHLYFPVTDQGSAPPQSKTSPAQSGDGEHILYVDDDEALVFMTTRMLKRLNYTVTGFQNPTEALAAFEADPFAFDVVISDMSMPYMGGPDLVKQMRAIRADLPIIMVTGYIRPEDTEEARNLGSVHLILKPNTVQELSEVLHEILSKIAS